jgi:phosphoribosylformylglycinamidine cyclo-ligase
MQKSITYKDAGVDIAAGDRLVEHIKPLAKATLRSEIMTGIGGFGALCEISKKYKNPVIVSGTDGVGTKLKLAFTLGRHDTIGIDLVAMSVNDILVQGAEPLFFLDYFACSKLNVDVAKQVISGIANGCMQANCSLIGGETAEMPGMYQDGEYDLAGFAVGVVEKDQIIDGTKIQENDIIIGIASNGFHSNGYSLVRKLITQSNLDLSTKYSNEQTWGEAILQPTTIYVKPVLDLLKKINIHGMGHITGSGITGNLARVFPQHLAAEIKLNSLPQNKLFEWAASTANLNQLQMLETFNCGIGYVLIISANDVERVTKIMDSYNMETFVLGKVITRTSQEIVYI